MPAVSLTKIVIIGLLCFDITEYFFESNVDLILRFLDVCIGYCCTVPTDDLIDLVTLYWLLWNCSTDDMIDLVPYESFRFFVFYQ